MSENERTFEPSEDKAQGIAEAAGSNPAPSTMFGDLTPNRVLTSTCCCL